MGLGNPQQIPINKQHLDKQKGVNHVCSKN